MNLHVREVGGPAWRWQLMFRDWLRAHDAERDAYAAMTLQAQGGEIEAYLDAKGPWMTAALVRAEKWAVATGWRPGE